MVAEGTGRYRVAADATPRSPPPWPPGWPSATLACTDLRTGRSLEEAYLAAVGEAATVEEAPPPAAGPGGAGGVGGPADEALVAQVRVELYMTLRRGETLLLTLGIPVAFLVFFTTVHVVSTPGSTAVDFFVPGILALAIMSTAMVSLGIATGFERGYGVLKRLGTTPLGRPRLLGAKIATVVLVELLQAAVLVPVGYALGWDPGGRAAAGRRSVAPWRWPCWPRWPSAGIGLLMAGVLRAEVNLAAVNGLYLVLLLLGGMIVPLAKLPRRPGDVAKALPAAALSERPARRAGHRDHRSSRVLGGAGRLGGGRPAGRRLHLPLGVTAPSAAGQQPVLPGGELGRRSSRPVVDAGDGAVGVHVDRLGAGR